MQSIGSDALFKSTSPSVRLTGEGLDPTASRHAAAGSCVYSVECPPPQYYPYALGEIEHGPQDNLEIVSVLRSPCIWI